MSFASIHFIFLFLPVFLLGYMLLPKGNWRTALLVLGSLVFFAWVDFAHLTLLRLFIRVKLLWGRVIGHLFVRSKPAVHRGVLWIGVSLNLASSVFTNTLVFLIRSFSASLH